MSNAGKHRFVSILLKPRRPRFQRSNRGKNHYLSLFAKGYSTKFCFFCIVVSGYITVEQVAHDRLSGTCIPYKIQFFMVCSLLFD